MAETPSCCDTEWDLLRKILLEFLSQATNPPSDLFPLPSDGQYNLYRKILLTLAYL